ncbi:MAG: PP2C family serine/threonine-protein phosphatase [Paludibacteraceae bacterium]
MNDNKVANISIRGYSHILDGKDCQDCSISWQEKRYDAVIVCDGHGGEKYFRSAIGSRFACEAGRKMISEFMGHILSHDETKTNWNMLLSQLEISIINDWNERVCRHFSENPFESDAKFSSLNEEDKRSLRSSYVKAYGSTFIAAVLTDKFLLVLKLGDGNVCALYGQHNICMLDKTRRELSDEQLQFNLTTSLCNGDAAKSFKHCIIPINKSNRINGVLLSSDGVINSFKSEETYMAFAEDIFKGFREQKLGNAKQELADFLPELSKKGSGDDLSIGIICEKRG